MTISDNHKKGRSAVLKQAKRRSKRATNQGVYNNSQQKNQDTTKKYDRNESAFTPLSQ
jgi:hypothetical protein